MSARQATAAAATWIVLAAGWLFAPQVTTLAGDRGQCTSAVVEEQVQLPDGSLQPPGRLTLCDSRSFSPVSTIHATYMNGMPVGMLLSRRGTSEGGAERQPFVMLYRDGSGLLHLYGYAVPSGKRMVTYRMQQPRSTGAPQMAGDRKRPKANSAAPATLLLAARVN